MENNHAYKKLNKLIIYVLATFIIIILGYTLILPIYPLIAYNIYYKPNDNQQNDQLKTIADLPKFPQNKDKEPGQIAEAIQEAAPVKEVEIRMDAKKCQTSEKEPGQEDNLCQFNKEVQTDKNNEVVNKETINKPNSINRIIIDKIGVDVPIIQSESARYGLSKGAWLDTNGTAPDQGGNTIITAHRYKYLPPSNLTFYLLDKLVAGDFIEVIWNNETYIYKVKTTMIVDNSDTSVLGPSPFDIITLYSCHPIYSQDQKLIVIGERI